jgi:hypothetical protein
MKVGKRIDSLLTVDTFVTLTDKFSRRVPDVVQPRSTESASFFFAEESKL